MDACLYNLLYTYVISVSIVDVDCGFKLIDGIDCPESLPFRMDPNDYVKLGMDGPGIGAAIFVVPRPCSI